MRWLVLLIAALSASGSVLADVDCHYDSVEAIQPQQTIVLISVRVAGNGYWKRLANQSDAFAASYQAIAQHALATGAQLMLRFPDGHDCTGHDYGTVPKAIRVDD